MGKQGPCYHCGVTNTPLWRNGPPEKPVLCNACGSRWRTKGSLANYTPLHARAEADDKEDNKFSKVKSMSVNRNRGTKMLKRKANQENILVKRATTDFNQGFKKVVDEDASNRSSSGSAISNSESCVQIGSADGSELTGPAQSNAWDTVVPSKRRTCVGRPKPSPVEKLTKDLFTILQEQRSSCLSGSSEEDLLFESETLMVSVEIGHGSVLMRHPHSSAREEESEASSLSIENKNPTDKAYSHTMKSIGNGAEKAADSGGQAIQQEQPKRAKLQNEKLQVSGSHSSPLGDMDLKDVCNFDEFVGQLTDEEQQQLMKLLPLMDRVDLPDSLRSMLESSQFKENFNFFQQLLAEGVFDMSSSGVKPEGSKMLKKLALSDLTKSHLVERDYQFKDRNFGAGGSATIIRGANLNPSSNIAAVKRICEGENQKNSEERALMKSPKRAVMKMKPNYETKETTEDEVSCFSPRRLFAFPPDGGPVMFGSEGNSDQDLLLDVPSNGSFPQAELLYQL